VGALDLNRSSAAVMGMTPELTVDRSEIAYASVLVVRSGALAATTPRVRSHKPKWPGPCLRDENLASHRRGHIR
jgi:hypothetical protein